MRILVVTACAAMLAATAPATAQLPSAVPTPEDDRQLSIIFGQVDADHDRKLTKVEMSAFGAARNLGSLVRSDGWKAMDADRNGTLSREEFVTGMVKARLRRHGLAN